MSSNSSLPKNTEQAKQYAQDKAGSDNHFPENTEQAKQYAQDTYDSLANKAGNAKDDLSDKAGQWKNDASDSAQNAKDKAANAPENTDDGSLVDTARSTFRDGADFVSKKAEDLKDYLSK